MAALTEVVTRARFRGRIQRRKSFRIPLDSVGICSYTGSMGLRLRRIREAKGLSLRELAAGAGVDYTEINRIELGKVTPRLATLEKLAKALGVSLRDLIEK